MEENEYLYELLREVKNVETQVSKIVSVESEQVSLQSELVSLQSEQASEAFSVVSDTAEYISSIKQHTEIEVILFFVVIAFCGFISGLLITNLIRK